MVLPPQTQVGKLIPVSGSAHFYTKTRTFIYNAYMDSPLEIDDTSVKIPVQGNSGRFNHLQATTENGKAVVLVLNIVTATGKHVDTYQEVAKFTLDDVSMLKPLIDTAQEVIDHYEP